MGILGLLILAWAWLGPIVAIFISGHPIWAVVIAIFCLLGLEDIRGWGCVVWLIWLIWGIIATYTVGGWFAISVAFCWVVIILS